MKQNYNYCLIDDNGVLFTDDKPEFYPSRQILMRGITILNDWDRSFSTIVFEGERLHYALRLYKDFDVTKYDKSDWKYTWLRGRPYVEGWCLLKNTTEEKHTILKIASVSEYENGDVLISI